MKNTKNRKADMCCLSLRSFITSEPSSSLAVYWPVVWDEIAGSEVSDISTPVDVVPVVAGEEAAVVAPSSGAVGEGGV